VTVSDPIAIFKQPLWFYMAWHSTLACYLSVAFAVAGWYAYRLLRGQNDRYTRAGLVAAMILGGTTALLQPLSGDLLAKYVFKTQPVKFAAMEGQFKTETGAPLRIGGWPNEETKTTTMAIEIPGGLSFLATGDTSAEVVGLEDFPRDEWPSVELTHTAFQIMVGSGTVLMLVSVWFWIAWLRSRENIGQHRWLMIALCIAAPFGFIGLESGWVVTEAGRQPWIIHQVMRTHDTVTPAEGVLGMFIAFTLLYALLGVTVIVLLRKLALPSESPEAKVP
jgi:cytochrome d ubiquinol oxidase subunit I